MVGERPRRPRHQNHNQHKNGGSSASKLTPSTHAGCFWEDEMESAMSSSNSKFKHQKRPDSLKLELLSVPEDGSLQTFPGRNTVGFRDVSYSVREGLTRSRKRTLLHKINGEFISGELTAIMGPSGAGKSSLMNILAGFAKNGVTGTLTVNEEIRDENTFRTQSCYIMQDDNLQPLLTVYEAMTVAANLKLGSEFKHKDKEDKIKEVLHTMSMWEHRNAKTNALSGGQRKRLSIALELLKNPQFLFFDEPTSGLDIYTSKQCVSMLKQLAASGRTVVCTIHQPSASIFEMFDHLYALADGKCIYQGSIKGLIPYLEEVDLRCPSHYNPADYLLDVATGEYGDYVDILVAKSKNGDGDDWRKCQRNSWWFKSFEDNVIQNGGPVSPLKKLITKKEKTAQIKKKPVQCGDRQYPTSFRNQLLVLLKRNFLILTRDPTLTYFRLLTHTLIALFLGILYFGIGKDASNILNNLNFIFFTVMFLMFTAFSCVTTTFPYELPIITKEHFNRWYSLTSYYLAVTFSDVTVQMIATLIYALVTYFMTMQPVEVFRLTYFLNMCVLVSLVAQSFGLMIGASMDIKNGVIFGPLLVLPFTIFSGFFVQLCDAHPYFQWVFHLSFLKYGFEGLALSVFGYDRGKLPCETDYCHFVYPEKFLVQMDMGHAQYYVAVLALLGINLIIRVCAFIALYLQIARKK